MFVDSHCHLNFPELAQNLPDILARMEQNQVSHALVVSVNMPDWPGLMALVEPHANLFASVGVHPDYENTPEPSVDELVQLAQSPKVVAIGETGLDYFRLSEPLDWQRERFRTHIQASKKKQTATHYSYAGVERRHLAHYERRGGRRVRRRDALLYRILGSCQGSHGLEFLYFLVWHRHVQKSRRFT